MKFIKYNRPAAMIVLAVVIVLAIFGGVNRSVAGLNSKLDKIYNNGSRKYGTVAEDLKKCSDYAQNLYSIVDSYGCADEDFEPALEALKASLDSPTADSSAAGRVFSAASISYNKLLNVDNLSKSQENSAISYFYELESVRMELGNNAQYNSIAKKYNQAIDSFPASVLTFGKDKAVTFN